MIGWLRLIAPLYLTIHAALALANIAEPGILVVGVLAASLGGQALARRKPWVALVALTGTYAGLWAVFRFILLFWPQTMGFWDYWPTVVERQLLLLGIPFILFGFFGYLGKRKPSFLPAERLLHAVLLAMLFWDQGGYRIFFYPHPLWEALSLCLFILAEAGVLAFQRLTYRRSLVWIPASLLVIATGSGLLWSVLNHYEEASIVSGGGLLKPQALQFDFSPLVRLESRISLDDKLILLYREDGPPVTRYLRRFILSGYSRQKGFFISPQYPGEAPQSVGKAPTTFPLLPDSTQARVTVRQEYFLVNLDPSSFLSLNDPIALQPLQRWNQSSFVNAYRVISKVPTDYLWQIDSIEHSGLTSSEKAHYTNYGHQEWLKALARSWVEGAQTPLEKVAAIEDQLKTHYWYSLNPGPAAGDPLKQFLLTTKKGYCTYFAFAMALLLRSVGVPSRIAVGFYTNPEEGLLGFYPVRAMQAHAWVEVPFQGFGWIPFDPTSDRLAPGETFRNPPQISPQQMENLISEVLKANPRATVATLPPASPWQQFWDSVQHQAQNWWPLGLLILLVISNLALRGLWRLRWKTSEPRAKTEALFRRYCRELRWAGIIPFQPLLPEQIAVTDLGKFMAQAVSQARYSADYSNAQSQEAWLRFLGSLGERQKLLGIRFLLCILLPPWFRSKFPRRRA